jgi:20S proteasome alpha/beta subunit
MTVVLAMETSPGYVMLVGDERQTSGAYRRPVRMADITQKIASYGDSHLVGFSGSLSFSNEIIDRLASDTTNKELKDKANHISDIVAQYRDDLKKRIVKDEYGVDVDYAIKEKPDLNPSIVKEVIALTNDINKSFYTDFIVGGNHKEYESALYLIPFTGPPIPIDKFHVIGSGADKAEVVVKDYLQLLKPEKRAEIRLADGCRIMMQAARSSWGNEGVGGRTQVMWTNKDEKYKSIGSDESELLQNSLFAETKNYLDRDFTDGVFRDIIEQGATAGDMMKRLGRKLSKKDLLRLYFTDGRHS